MSRLARLLSLDRIASQITVLLIVASVGSFLVTMTAVLAVLSEQDSPTAALAAPVRIVTALKGLDASSGAAREQLAASYRDEDIDVRLDDEASDAQGGDVAQIIKDSIVRRLPTNLQLLTIKEERPDVIKVVVRLGDGHTATVLAQFSKLALRPPPVLLPLVFLLASTILLSVWAAHRLVAPLSRFAAAADRFGRDGGGEYLDERGPAEIRRASNAFNRMRERINRLIDDRTSLLLAISHDLRTPLTRLRLRTAELSPADAFLKSRILDDIKTMDSSITAAVTYLREGVSEEPAEMAELSSTLNTICDQFADAGFSVEYDGPPRLAIRCRPRTLERAVTNLVDNAVKYGSHVHVLLEAQDGRVAIEVQDDGPGIPDAEKQRVVEPFYRSDSARKDVRGFGLGLAIVSSIVQSHGGTFILLDNAPHGLRARMDLPTL
jgi:signal transduction histidine kinase